MGDTLVEIDKIINDIISNTLTSSSNLFLAAKFIAAIGFIIYVYFEGYAQILGEKFEWKKLGSPLAILLGIFFYGTFLNITNSILGMINESVKEELHLTDERFYEKLDDYVSPDEEVSNKQFDTSLQKIRVENKSKILKIDPNDFKKEDSWLGKIIDKTYNGIEAGMLAVIYTLFKSLAEFAILILLIIRGFFLIVLSIFGIFAIALSIYPPLKGSFATWLQKYINVYLWLPVSYIMEYILLKLLNLSGNITSSGSTDTPNDVMFFICLTSLIGFAMVPVISSWFVNAATVSAASKLKGKAQAAGEVAKKTVKKIATKAATGGIG